MRVVDPREPGEPGNPRVRLDDGGFVMVALLIGIAISAVWMSALLPSWHQQQTREREAELIFRGEQYARAIYLYRQRNNQAPPPNVDTLVSQRYLRKKYLDPMTGKDFLIVGGITTVQGGRGVPGPAPGASTQTAGITGVRSTSNETSIVLYRNQTTYSQFPFDWNLEAQRSGTILPPGGRGGAGGITTPDGRGRDGGSAGRGGLGPARGGFGPAGPGGGGPGQGRPGGGRGGPPTPVPGPGGAPSSGAGPVRRGP
jgi:type II secretory pathway pseudopilin PulG